MRDILTQTHRQRGWLNLFMGRLFIEQMNHIARINDVHNEDVPDRTHPNIHEHVDHRRKFQHGSQTSDSPKRCSVQHGKPGKYRSRKGDANADTGDSRKQKHSGHSSDYVPGSKKPQSHGKSSRSNRKSGKPSRQ
ncbi:hypothetical protein DFH28DRAFT_1113093 [Melampsora americana]|nr:hypothetical protein DFH28DRAFT_1113093 [Melampsora americana]